MTTGIYLFKFPSNLPYIGQSVDIERRKVAHCNKMQQGKHSKKVQAEYDKYKTLPSFEILAECTVEELNDYENECIEIYDSVNNGLNTLEKAEDCPKYDGPITGTDTVSFKTYTKDQILDVFYYLVYEPTVQSLEIEKLTGVKRCTITNISAGRNHIWLQETYPEEYARMILLRSTRKNNMGSYKVVNTRPLLLSPNGTTYDLSSKSVYSFAREYDLSAQHITSVLNSRRKSHRGWRLAPEQGV